MVKSTIRQSGQPNAVVVLMHEHEYAATTVEALPLIVEGYEFGVID